MWLFLFSALMLPVVIFAATYSDVFERTRPDKVAKAEVEIAALRAFVLGANRYLRDNPNFTGTLTGAALKADPNIPLGLKSPWRDDWKVVVDASGEVFCTQMSDLAARSLQQIFAPKSLSVYPLVGGEKLVVATDAGEAAAEVGKCN